MDLELNGVFIDDTFAEAFGMRYARLIVTAADSHWLQAACDAFCGYGTSVIACDAETGVEQHLTPGLTPDGRPGAALLAFSFSTSSLQRAVVNRSGQCLMTCPTTALFDGCPELDQRIELGSHLRFFGDGYQRSKLLGERFWRIPVMDGEFVVSHRSGSGKGIAGGNIILQAADSVRLYRAARRAVAAIADCPGVIAPFPGGVVRSGSKVGSRYRKLKASTNDAFCPTLRGRVPTQLADGVSAACEIVIDGIDEAAVVAAMKDGIQAACGPDLIAVSAGNYGGGLGKYHLHLHKILGE